MCKGHFYCDLRLLLIVYICKLSIFLRSCFVLQLHHIFAGFGSKDFLCQKFQRPFEALAKKHKKIGGF